MYIYIHVHVCTYMYVYVYIVYMAVCFSTGSLDRCIDGETARIVLKNAQSPTKTTPTSSAAPLQVRSLKAEDTDSLIQVCVYIRTCIYLSCVYTYMYI